jgi:DNA-binding transcriptional ArsR family regulator
MAEIKESEAAKEQARVLKVLSVEARVKIVHLLKIRSMCVNALACRLGISQGAVSQHLRIMRDAGLVIDEKRGYYVHYRLNRETLYQWKRMLDDLLILDKNETQETGEC